MLTTWLSTSPLILAECAVAERLRRVPGVELHPTLFNTPLIYGPEKSRDAMSDIYREYLGIAREARLPLLLTAPTWRLDASRVAAASVPSTINRDAVAFMQELRASAPSDQAPLILGALVGPRNDCYRPDLAPSTDDAEAFHTSQIQELAATDVDLLLAQTLPSTAEALGIARAMAASGKPYIISFCTGPDGQVLDGTSLPNAMAKIDDSVDHAPVGYLVNCTHPRFILDAYPTEKLERLIGIQANGSSKDVTSLDGSEETQADPIDDWAAAMQELHQTHQLTILGGCCGTNTDHLRMLCR